MTAGDDGDKNKIFMQQLGELFRTHRRELCRAAYKFAGNWQNAEDAVQNAFGELLQQRSEGVVIKNPTAYVHAAVVHRALDSFRKQKQEKRTYLNDAECEQVPAPESFPGVDERVAYVPEALKKMKPKLVRTLDLCCVEKRSCRDVAKMLRRPVGTVLTDLWRGKFQLKRLIRIQEKHNEAQKNRSRGIAKPGLADSSGA